MYFLRRGFVTFSPPGAWCGDTSEGCEKTIKRGNDIILRLSSLMTVCFIPGVDSQGTADELAQAAARCMQIIVVCSEREDIAAAIAWVNPIIGSVPRDKRLNVEYAVMVGSKMENVSIISYDPVRLEEPSIDG